jgi:CRISPR-associated protein Csd1
MIIRELVRYYDRKALDPDPTNRLPSLGLEDKEIPFVIELATDGAVIQLVDTRQLDGKKLRARSFLVPSGVKKTSGVKANLLWDTAAYSIGLARERKNAGDITPNGAFIARIEALPPAIRERPGIAAVLAAQRRADWSVIEKSPTWPEIVDTNPVITFRLLGDDQLVCQDMDLLRSVANADDGDEESPQAICLVDGTEQPVQRLHTSIKGVWGAQSSGANIVSFNARAFESYGKTERQGENAPIGKRAAFAYTTALNHLLAKGSRNRVQVGDSSAVFWADGPAPLLDGEFTLADYMGERPDQPDRGVQAVQALYRALSSGQVPIGERDVRFFVLGLAPNAARISVRFWIQATVGELAPRIRQHFDDLKVVRAFDKDPPVPSLFRLLSDLAVQGKVDNVPPRLAGEWIRSILEGLPYPALLLNAAVIRCKAERDVSYLRASVLKAWLNRDTRRRTPSSPRNDPEFKENLDMDQTDTAYRLGRLFAVLERIQQKAQPGINATIRDRYYGAASTTPVSVFTTLLRLKNAHLKKLSDGEANYFERLLGGIFGTLEAPVLLDFPRQLSLPDQGRFALGYYHQRQSFFAGRKADEPEAAAPDSETQTLTSEA